MVLKEANDSDDPVVAQQLTSQLESYWQNRFELLRRTGNGDRNSEEVRAFVYWLGETRLPPSVLKDRLLIMIERLEAGFEFHYVSEYLERFAATDPIIIIQILRVLVARFVRRPDIVWVPNQLPTIMETISTRISDPSSKALLRNIVSDMLEYRSIDFRQFIAALI